MILNDFVWLCSKKLRLGEHKVRLVKDKEVIYDGTFLGLLMSHTFTEYCDDTVTGVSMMLSAANYGSAEYATMISI